MNRRFVSRVSTLFVALLFIEIVFNIVVNENYTKPLWRWIRGGQPRAVLFPNKPLVIWSISNHPSPIADIQQLLETLGVRFKVFVFDRCQQIGVCDARKKLKVVNLQSFMFKLKPSTPREFYESYKNDSAMREVDAFLCFDPAAICELYPSFNKSVIVVASNRYHLGRETNKLWTAWNELLKRYAADQKNFVGANNLYDAKFMRYYTGIDAKVLRSYGGYANVSYNPSTARYLTSRKSSPGFIKLFQQQFMDASKSLNGNATIDSLNGKHSYSYLAAHSGVVHIPYQVSTMSIFEQYQMAIPLFFPTKRLLLEWNVKHYVMYERTWEGQITRNAKDIPADPSQTHIPTPSNNYNATAMKYWIEFCDWYQWPHITYFDSVLELAKLLNTLTVDDLLTISEKMKRYSATVREEILDQWTQVLLNVAKYSDNHPH